MKRSAFQPGVKEAFRMAGTLRYVAPTRIRTPSGRPNQAIAGELVVTLDTVKKHVSHFPPRARRCRSRRWSFV